MKNLMDHIDALNELAREYVYSCEIEKLWPDAFLNGSACAIGVIGSCRRPRELVFRLTRQDDGATWDALAKDVPLRLWRKTFNRLRSECPLEDRNAHAFYRQLEQQDRE